MNEIDPNKYLEKINKGKKKVDSRNVFIKKYFFSFVLKSMVVLIFIAIFAIVYKSDSFLKDKISDYFFMEDISFVKIKKFYDKYLGGILPLKNDNTVTDVFDEKLQYENASIYYDGVKFNTSSNYLVPALDEGMVVFVGEKENYGNTIIVENLNGIYYWYGNVDSSSLKLYDYVEKGSLIGEVNEEFYMVFSKDGKYLNYEEFIY